MGKVKYFVVVFLFLIGFSFLVPNVVKADVLDNEKPSNVKVETNIDSVLNMDGKVPSDYVENAVSPHGLEKGEWTMSVIQNELALFKSNKNESGKIDYYNELSSGNNLSNSSIQLSDNNSVSYVAGVAFNPSAEIGKKCYGAYLGINKISGKHAYFLQVIDLRNGSTVTNIRLSYADWFSNVPQFNYKNFISITAGDYDNDKVDEIAIIVSADDSIFVNIYNGDNFQHYVQYAYTSLIDQNFVRMSHMPRVDWDKKYRPVTSMASGDFDGDGVAELAISISSSKGMKDSSSRVEEITTNVAILDNPMDKNGVKISKHQLYSLDESSDGNEKIKVLYSSQITAGDIDGDCIDEVVVAGYLGEVNKNGQSVTNQFIVNQSQFGLLSIRYFENGYSQTVIKEADMNEFVKDGFYAGDDVWNVISVGCAKMSGNNGAESVFISGSIFDFSIGTPILVYTYDLFKQESARGSNAYVESVVVGNFTNEDIYRESFAFTICYKYIGSHYYSYQLGVISGVYEDNFADGQYSDCNSFEDNSNSVNGKYEIDEKSGYVADESKFGTNFCIVCADNDDDGLKIKYMGTNYMYSDPQIKVVLQAAPYFSQLGKRGDFYNSTSYTIQTSYTTENSDSHAWSVGAGAYIEGKVNAIIVDSKLRVQLSSSIARSWGDSTAVTKSYSDTFQASTYDTVVLSRIPSVEYEYTVWDSNRGIWDSSKFASVLVALKPVYYQLSVEDYNEFVGLYNEKLKNVTNPTLLKTINSTILPENTDGNPSAYFSSLPEGGELLSPSTYVLSHNGGNTTAIASESVSKSTFSSFTGTIGASVNWSIGAGALFAKVEVGAFVDGSFSRTLGSSIVKINETDMSGTINNITSSKYPDEKEVIEMYKFNWNLASWKANLTSKENDFVRVVGYLVNGVSTAGNSPRNIEVALNNDRSKVIVSWEAPKESQDNAILKGYNVYRKKSGSSVLTKINEAIITSTNFEDSEYRSFLAGVQYEYHIGAVYENNSKTYTCIALDYCVIVGGVYNEGTVWYAISSLNDIKSDGNYYLNTSIDLAETYRLEHNVALDLNGFELSNNNSEALIIIDGVSLAMYDSRATGKLVSNNGKVLINNLSNGNAIIYGGNFETDATCIVNQGTLNINGGNFVSNKSNLITNQASGNLTLDGGIFYGTGTNLVSGLHNYGTLNMNKVDFRHFITAVKLYNDSKINIGSEGVNSKNIVSVEIINQNGKSVAGVFTNYVPAIAQSVFKVFESVISNSNVYVNSLGEFAICEHSFDSVHIETQPTCVANGLMKYTCGCCGKVVKRTILAYGHNYGDWIPEINPTENTYGTLAHYHCDRCCKDFNENKEEIHSLYIGKSGKGIISIEKTKTENGFDIFTILYSDGSTTTYSVPTTQSQTIYAVIAYIGLGLALIALVILLVLFISKKRMSSKNQTRKTNEDENE